MSDASRDSAVMLVSHGTVASLDEIPAFLRAIRRGREAPPELVEEVLRRYEAIGGRSPLRDICDEIARKVSGFLGVPVRAAGRLAAPLERDVLAALKEGGARRVAVVPLAQLSSSIYADSARAAAADVGVEVACAGNWGTEPALVRAFSRSVTEALSRIEEDRRAAAKVLFTAHSLPVAVVEAGDPYPEVFAESARAVADAAGFGADRWSLAYQSQGMGTGPGGRPMVWLGPDLRAALEALAAGGATDVVVAPIGFLADHVEILYDLDIEAVGWAAELGLRLFRAASPNAGDDLVEAICALARPLLREEAT